MPLPYILGQVAKVAGAGFAGYGEDKQDAVKRVLDQQRADREDNESRMRMAVYDTQRREAEHRIGETPVTFKMDADGNYVGLPSRVGPSGVPPVAGGGLLRSAPTGGLSGSLLPAVPAEGTRQQPSVMPIATGVHAPIKPPPKAPSIASAPSRIATTSDGKRFLTQRDPATGVWNPARTPQGDTVFTPSPAPKTDPIVALVKSAQARVDQQSRDMRAVLARRPRTSQFADPLTRMPDSTAMNEALGNWRTDSTAQASSLQAARDELERLKQPNTPTTRPVGRSHSGASAPKGIRAGMLDRGAWAASNPPKAGESFDAYQARYERYLSTGRP